MNTVHIIAAIKCSLIMVNVMWLHFNQSMDHVVVCDTTTICD